MEVVRKPQPTNGRPAPDVCVITVGDIHGEFSLLVKLLEIAKHIIPKKATTTKLILLGDVIDRGEDSLQVLDSLMQPCPYWDVIPIMGNHEQLMLNMFAASEETFKMKWILWRGNGGSTMMLKSGLNLQELSGLSIADQKQAIRNAIGPKRVDFINSFASHYINGNVLCVHAGIDPNLPIRENFAKPKLSQDDHHYAWIREPFLQHDRPFPDDMFVVHGHSVIPGPQLENHRLGLDTGACINGVLSAGLFFNGQLTLFQVTPD